MKLRIVNSTDGKNIGKQVSFTGSLKENLLELFEEVVHLDVIEVDGEDVVARNSNYTIFLKIEEGEDG